MKKAKGIGVTYCVVFILLFASPKTGYSQSDTIRCMFYNLLHFPDPVPDGRWDTFANILNYYDVDLLMMCELESAAGADSLLEHAFNVNGSDNYRRATYVEQQSSYSGWGLQQLIIYNRRKLALYEEDIILTNVRDINVYKMYLREDDLSTTGDTTFLDVYVTHLKSSQGGSNELLRENAVDSLLNYLSNQPPDHHVIFAGDFNVYSSSEPAYQKLISTQNPIVLEDPINTPGNWNNNNSYADVHTQSTRTSPLYGDGAGGGLDDRFDFILLSESMMNGTNDLSYLQNSHEIPGNTGDCFNVNITQCDSMVYPYALLRSLRYMSDHLPVYLELTAPLLNDVPSSPMPATVTLLENPAGEFLNFRLENAAKGKAIATIYTITGKVVKRVPFQVQNTSHLENINISGLPDATYILRLEFETEPSRGIQFIHQQ